MSIALNRTPYVVVVGFVSVLVLLLWFSQASTPAAISRWAPARAAAQENTGAPPAQPAAQDAGDAPLSITGDALPATSSVPLSIAGDVGFNVLAALNANAGALRSVTIRPGATWSFNAAVGSPARVEVRTIGGMPGGGWCDLASRYVQAVRPLLPREAVQFVNHVATSGIRLADVADDDAVSIWNVDGQAGSAGQSQDLQITNTLDAPLHLQVVEQAGQQIVVRATVGGA